MSKMLDAFRLGRSPFGAFLCLLVSVTVISGSSLPEDAPILISERTSTRAVTGSLSGSDSSKTVHVFPAGTETLATLFVTNLDLMPGEGRTAFRADVQDAAYRRFPLQVVSFEPSSVVRGVYAITVRLRSDIGDVGDVLVRVTWRGMSSNRVRISIGHTGGRIQDDEGAIPTPIGGVPTSRNRTAERVGLAWSADRVRFIQQATFGTNASIESRVRRIGYTAWLNEQMEERRDANGNLRYSTYPYPSLPNFPAVPPGNCDGTSGNGNPVDTPGCFRNQYSMWPLQNWFFREALYSEDQQLRRRISWALSQIFVVGGRETVQPARMQPYIEILDRHAFGNYRNLLTEITVNPAMGAYLDMAISTAQAPNENYPREILQLFSIGVDRLNPDGTPVVTSTGAHVPAYDQNTINEFTKVFTGWSNCNSAGCPNAEPGFPNFRDPMVANPANHDQSQKVLFSGTVLPAGQSPEADLAQALDNIFYHPNVGPFFSKLMIQQLVTSNPTPAYVGRVAAVFNNNGSGIRGDMKALIRAILLDPEARGNYKTDPDFGHLREPVLFLTNMLKPFSPQSQATAPAACNGQSDGVLNLLGTLPLDQEVFLPPSVFNYYPMDYYIPGTNLSGPEFGIFSTGTALKRPNLVNLFTAPNNNPATPGVPLNANQTINQGVAVIPNPNYAPCGTRIDLTRLQTLAANDPTGEQLVDLLNIELLHRSMSPAMRGDVLNGVVGIPASNPVKRARTALYLIATSPQFQVQR
jgi:hypothetical protein